MISLFLHLTGYKKLIGNAHNKSAQSDACFAGAAGFKRVCRAWHLTSQMKVLIPGIRRAEG